MATNEYEKQLLKAQRKEETRRAKEEAQLNVNPPKSYNKIQNISRSISAGASRFGNKFNKRFSKGGAKSINRNAKATRNLLTAIGATGLNKQHGGAGRPRGTYKYGVPIQQYKKLKNQRAALYSAYAQKQQEELRGRGFTPQQIQELQLSRQSNVIPSSAADDELKFQKFVAENTVTPNTQNILDNLKRIQNKAITDDINQQRVHRERQMVNSQQSLLKARNLFGPDSNKMDIFDDSNNILKAENRFALANQENLFAPSGRPNILQTQATGNRFSAFTEDRNILDAPKVFSVESSSAHRLKFF